MCGLAGIWGDAENAEDVVQTMLSHMRHRGPDGAGLALLPDGAMGMVRLALMDLSDAGQQPFVDGSGQVALVFNGELYNFREHRARLRDAGFVFESTSDAEVALALYLEQGPEFVHDLRGMFAFALYDGRGESPRMLLGRDPFGMKPLLVARGHGNSVVYASELKSLLASGVVCREASIDAVHDFLLRGFVLQPGSMLRDVEMLAAGVCIDLAQGGREVARCRWYEEKPKAFSSYEEAVRSTREVLVETVEKHAFADAEVGVFLSGGVDSAVISTLMSRSIAQLRAYTLRFPDVPGGGEYDGAAEVASALGLVHCAVDVDGTSMAESLPQIMADLDQPSVDGFNTWFVSRRATADVKGVLSGLGGDEWFGGYPVMRRMARYTATRSGRAVSAAASLLSGGQRFVPSLRARARIQSLSSRRSPLSTWQAPHSLFQPSEAAALVRRPETDPLDGLRQTLRLEGADPNDERVVRLAMGLDVSVFMRSQLLRDSDAASMAHSLELRIPFVDQEIAALSQRLPDAMKMNPTGGASDRYEDSGVKRVLLDAVRDLLPVDLRRRRKQGFVLPVHHWLRDSPLGERVRDALSVSAVRSRGWLAPRLVQRHLASFRSGDVRSLDRVWGLTVLEWWARGTLDVVSRRQGGGLTFKRVADLRKVGLRAPRIDRAVAK